MQCIWDAIKWKFISVGDTKIMIFVYLRATSTKM
jgi:hypothetical protein